MNNNNPDSGIGWVAVILTIGIVIIFLVISGALSGTGLGGGGLPH
jgi:hypothetical protein